MRWIFKIYDYFATHTKMMWGSLVVLLLAMVLAISQVRFSEDISDFLPLENSEQEAFSVYQNISGANRLYILFNTSGDADATIDAIERFLSEVRSNDKEGWCADLTAQFDMERIMEVGEFVYDNIPYFLTPKDYERMEACLSNEEYVSQQMQRNIEMLMFPSGGMMTRNIMKDPLALFSPVLSSLQSSNQQMNFEMYDGYIFTPDMSRAVAMMNSPFGNSETEYNSKLVKLLNGAIEVMHAEHPTVTAHIVGGPEIAVGNASRIKTDSILAISLSVVLITLLVIYSISSIRNLLLIFLSIGWGWLFSLGAISLVGGEVSIIVIGISSVILGIAVNYPLHLVVHMGETPSVRDAIKEIFLPLVIGNITTVGAFLTLVPLQSVALRDLGIFASLLLVGTIVFVLVYLPHLLKKSEKREQEHNNKLLNRIASISLERSRVAVAGVVVISIILAFYSTKSEFDANLANSNYMSSEQRADMAYFQSILAKTDSNMRSVYVLASGENFEQALCENSAVVPNIEQLVDEGIVSSYRGVSQFLVSKEEQAQRLEMWRTFVNKHYTTLTKELHQSAMRCGFSERSFASFDSLVANSAQLQPQDIEYFAPLTKLLFSQNVTFVKERNRAYIVNTLNVPSEQVESVKSHFANNFDVEGMNSALANNLSDNFNYIGWACSLIVFFFLWFSFGRVELAIISFIPMAVSWVWILGIMALVGVKFNIVNVILATFIFGQGDDYTIFMTEGCQYEYRHGRPILNSYKSSILHSALIMFVGIGTLIISKHPAMRSLAEVTIIGMVSVLLMAYMIPPLLFRWLTTKNGVVRPHPITLATLLFGEPKEAAKRVQGRYIYKSREIMRSVSANLKAFDANMPLSRDEQGNLLFEDKGYGEQAMLVALTHPEAVVMAHISDAERCEIATIAAKDFVNNIKFYI